MMIVHIVGARPNFMKAAPVIRALGQYEHITQTLIHTGQHYDQRMSDVFFHELELPPPDYNLDVGSGSHTTQTAQVMLRLEELLEQQPCDLMLVYGDVNSTLAAALVAVKRGIRLGHVEAGLRSFDRTMPEEINRILTDQMADLLFTPSEDGDANLLREGIAAEQTHRVGNVMIDTLTRLLPAIQQRWQMPLHTPWHHQRYVLATLHRPSNVDDPASLRSLLEALADISQLTPIIFPIHPRTHQRIQALGLTELPATLHLSEPLGYLDFLALQQHAALVITDSGGIQEETTFLQVPCLTVRANTERPITVTLGTNTLVGHDRTRLRDEAATILREGPQRGRIPPLWDGKASERIAQVLAGNG